MPYKRAKNNDGWFEFFKTLTPSSNILAPHCVKIWYLYCSVLPTYLAKWTHQLPYLEGFHSRSVIENFPFLVRFWQDNLNFFCYFFYISRLFENRLAFIKQSSLGVSQSFFHRKKYHRWKVKPKEVTILLMFLSVLSLEKWLIFLFKTKQYLKIYLKIYSTCLSVKF